MTSILEQARSEGYRDGAGQMSMVCYDEAYELGRRDQEAKHWGECKRWWMFGVMCGVGASAIVGWLV